MKRTITMMPLGALVLALSVVGTTAAAAQDRQGRDRSGRHSEGQARERQSDGARGGERSRAESQDRSATRGDSGGNRGAAREAAPPRDNGRADVAPNREQRPVPAPERGVGRNDERARGDARGGVAVPRPDDRRRDDRWNAPRGGGYDYRNNDRYRGDDRYRYNGGARLIVPVRPLPHYYGSGGRFSVYFGLGSGYLFGSPYAGRVYGYVGPHTYGARIYYGDVRLMVRPRDAAVYVDGYYAGVVDDFDGVFQRLTLEVGPHQIELDAPGLEPQYYDVYVDPAQTVTIRSDLYPY
ncbi:MAG: PEGA domain-containing protein [Vicinamibacterales bacterium]